MMKNAVITGVSSGIGLATARSLAANGFKVYGSVRKKEDALKLKEVFGLDDVNKLPIVYNIAWYEQKAVIVLLALLALGVKNIHLGPTLPAFLSPNVKNVLIEQFGIGGISTADEDIMKFLS